MSESVTEECEGEKKEKRCSKCGGLGPFNKKPGGRGGLNSRCRRCCADYLQDWRKKNPELTRALYRKHNKLKLARDPEKYRKLNRKYSQEWTRAHPEVVMHRGAKHRAKREGLPFDLARGDIVIPTHCPLLGVPLQSGVGKHQANSPTLDRIIPALGYVKGNVWVISYKANVMKNDATLEELELLVRNLRASQG